MAREEAPLPTGVKFSISESREKQMVQSLNSAILKTCKKFMFLFRPCHATILSMVESVQENKTPAMLDNKIASKVRMHFIEEYPEEVMRILLAQPLNPIKKLEFSAMQRETRKEVNS